MPTYRYRGDVCDHEFEVRQSFSDDPITTCTICGQPVHRVISASPVVFKGSGWYITDSKPTTDSSGGVQDSSRVKSNGDDAPSNGKSDSKGTEKPAESSRSEKATTSASSESKES